MAGFNAKADPAKSAGIARATAANTSAALTVALVDAGVLKSSDEALKHFWSFYMELVPELIGETAAAPKAARATIANAEKRDVQTVENAEKALEQGGLTDAPGDTIVTFGKHKGRTLAAIHSGSDGKEADPEYITGNDSWQGLVKSRNEEISKAAQAFVSTL